MCRFMVGFTNKQFSFRRLDWRQRLIQIKSYYYIIYQCLTNPQNCVKIEDRWASTLFVIYCDRVKCVYVWGNSVWHHPLQLSCPAFLSLRCGADIWSGLQGPEASSHHLTGRDWPSCHVSGLQLTEPSTPGRGKYGWNGSHLATECRFEWAETQRKEPAGADSQSGGRLRY